MATGTLYCIDLEIDIPDVTLEQVQEWVYEDLKYPHTIIVLKETSSSGNPVYTFKNHNGQFVLNIGAHVRAVDGLTVEQEDIYTEEGEIPDKSNDKPVIMPEGTDYEWVVTEDNTRYVLLSDGRTLSPGDRLNPDGTIDIDVDWPPSRN